MLLPTAELRERLVSHFKFSERCWIYSAFITMPGVNLILDNRDATKNDRLLIRCNPSDVLSGACSLEALNLALSRGIQVRVSSALHVKLYLFDKILFVGSANLTGSGLALVGYCNDELSTVGVPSDRDIDIAENLWSEGVVLGPREIQKMRDYIEQLPQNDAQHFPAWPEEIFVEERSLYCSDFPQGGSLDECRWSTVRQFEASTAFLWLKQILKENGGKVSFGYLSSRLHDDVYDDPSPYRREIKDLLVNLIALIKKFKNDEISITVPGHSQILSLKRLSQDINLSE